MSNQIPALRHLRAAVTTWRDRLSYNDGVTLSNRAMALSFKLDADGQSLLARLLEDLADALGVQELGS